MSYAGAGFWGTLGQGARGFGDAIQRAINNIRYREEQSENERRYNEGVAFQEKAWASDQKWRRTQSMIEQSRRKEDVSYRRERDKVEDTRYDKGEAYSRAVQGAVQNPDGSWTFSPEKSLQGIMQKYGTGLQGPGDKAYANYMNALAEKARSEGGLDDVAERQRGAEARAFKGDLMDQVRRWMRPEDFGLAQDPLSEVDAYQRALEENAPLESDYPEAFGHIRERLNLLQQEAERERREQSIRDRMGREITVAEDKEAPRIPSSRRLPSGTLKF